jgi:hypothetical protein
LQNGLQTAGLVEQNQSSSPMSAIEQQNSRIRFVAVAAR